MPTSPERPPDGTVSPAESLRRAGFRGELRLEEPLATHTTWQIGGPAEILATPVDADDLARAVAWAHGRGLPWRLLGNGSNLLVSDAGVRGLVLRVRKTLDTVALRPPRLVAGAGASFPAVARAAAGAGLSGLEFAGGIPGTVGGAVVMNAGWHQFETGRVVESVTFLEPDGARRQLPAEQCAFGYRHSAFRGRPGAVLAAAFRLRPADPAAVAAEMERYVAARRTQQPVDQPSCGSVYLKPPGDFAGRLIEAAGLKGKRVGGIQVSTRHANFFVNTGGGTCADALALMEQVEAAVRSHSGVELTREVELWA